MKLLGKAPGLKIGNIRRKKTTLIIIFLASCRIKLFKFKAILPILKYLERGENPPLLFINNFTTNYAL